MAASPSRAAVTSVPKDAVQKLFLTSTKQSFHSGEAPAKEALAHNMHSIRERQHIEPFPPRAATAPQGGKWRGTQYTRSYESRPNTDYEMNKAAAEFFWAAATAAKKAPDAKTAASSYADSFRNHGNQPVVESSFAENTALGHIICSGVKSTGESMKQTSYAAPRKMAPAQLLPGGADNLGGVPTTYDFLNSTYGVDFRSAKPSKRRTRPVKAFSQVSLADIAAGPLKDARSIYQKQLLRTTSQKVYISQGL